LADGSDLEGCEGEPDIGGASKIFGGCQLPERGGAADSRKLIQHWPSKTLSVKYIREHGKKL